MARAPRTDPGPKQYSYVELQNMINILEANGYRAITDDEIGIRISTARQLVDAIEENGLKGRFERARLELDGNLAALDPYGEGYAP